MATFLDDPGQFFQDFRRFVVTASRKLGLNADLKQNITRKAPLRSKQALKQAAISHMHRLTKSPARVRSFFRQKSMRYAA